MNSFFLKTNNCERLHYRKTGQGPALLLIHGFPEDGQLWDGILSDLQENFTVIVPDIPGSGVSILGKVMTMESAADDVAAILKKEQIEEVVIAGHSMGGYIGLAFAERHSSMLKGFSLVHSTAKEDTEAKKELRRKSIELIRKGGKEPFVKGMIPNLFAKQFCESFPEIIQKQIISGQKLSAESMIAFYEAMIKRPVRTNVLKNAAFPVQWIIGKEDNVVPIADSLQQCHLSNVNFVSVYDDCGHMSMLENKDKLIFDIKEFMRYAYNH